MTIPSRGPGIRFPPPLVFVGFGLLGWSAERLIKPEPWSLPTWATLTVAGVLLMTGVVLVASAIGRFREAETPPEPWKAPTAITRRGPYSRTRNPMYLGMAFAHLAVAVGLQSIGILVALLPAVMMIDFLVVRREEAYLLDQFGDTYAEYKASVPRWL